MKHKLIWTKFKKWLSSENFTVTLYILRAVWYLTCFSFCSYYVVSNWSNLSKITLYDGITLESFIFFILIWLTIMPFIKKIELVGFKVETNMGVPEVLNKGVKEKLEDNDYLLQEQQELLKEAQRNLSNSKNKKGE